MKLLLKLTFAEAQQILTVLNWSKDDGCYYGHKKYYKQREDRLIKELSKLLEGLEDK